MEASELSRDIHAAQAVYSRTVLKIYDWAVLGISNRVIWRCPTPHLLDFYNRHVSANHLDVGVGTGFFLDRCTFPQPSPRLALLDLNDHCLRRTAKRIARFQPEMIKANVMEEIRYDGPGFESIGMNYLLHCLPGDIQTKTRSFDHVLRLLQPGGVIFGATLLSAGVQRNLAARCLMDIYNRQRIFNNRADSLADLRDALSRRFARFGMEPLGCAALFWGASA
jgi:ubiquinone/menaquinone biosynthesis C-methylase UbiE